MNDYGDDDYQAKEGDFVVPLPGFPGSCAILSKELRANAIKASTDKLRKLGKEISKAGEQMDRLSDSTPPHIGREKRERYLSALNQFYDALDTLKSLGCRVIL